MKLKSKVIKSKIIYVFVILALSLLFWRIIKDWQVVSDFNWKFNILNLLISIFLSFLAYFFNIYSWYILTKSLSINISLKDNFKVWIYSNLTRFLPGKIWQYPSRILLMSERKVENVVSGAATLMEVLLNLSSAALTVYISFIFWRFPEEFDNYYTPLIFFAIVPIITFFLFNKRSLFFFARLLKKITKKEVRGLDKINLPYRWIFPLILLFTLRFFITSGAILFLTKAFFPVSNSNFVVFLGASSLSWLLGYVAFFAPAGLGVREVSLATLLLSIIPFAVGSIIAVVYRLTILVTEASFLGIQLLFFRRKSSAI